MDLDGVGGRCALSSCRIVDYLPFRCTHCNELYCEKHYLPAGHTCARAPPSGQGTVPTCPICDAPVPTPRGEDPGAALVRHIDSGCPARRRANAVCAFKGCTVRDVVPVTCRSCRKLYCLGHRLEADHSCVAGPVGARAAGENGIGGAQSTSPGMAPTGASLSPSVVTSASAALHRLSMNSGHMSNPAQRLLSLSKRRPRHTSGEEIVRRPSTIDTVPTAQASPGRHAHGGTMRLSSVAGSGSATSVSSGAASGGPFGSPSPGSRASLTTLQPTVTFSNTPSTARGDNNVPEESRLAVALHYPAHLSRKSEYWVLNSRHSAGKILDSLKLPPPPPGSTFDRYSMYAVKRGGKGVNMLPMIVPLQDLGSELLQDGDALVVEIGESGLSSQWLNVLTDPSSTKKTKSSSRGKSPKAGKCVIS